MVSDSLKQCSVCKEYKPLTEFYNKHDSKDGKCYRCKECDNKARKKYAQNHPERYKEVNRNKLIKCRYGITQEEYEKLLQGQNYKCAICKSKIPKTSKNISFCIDHNHITGKVRGLLCSACNRALGLFKDSTDILYEAIKYLSREEKDAYI